MGEKMTPLVAAVDGTVSYITIPEASWGYGVVLRDSDGWKYWYLHINNDTPGTDDGNGGTANAFAAGIRRGTRVTRGQHIAFMGDSGNAEGTGSHLHFEIHRPDGSTIDPYWSLLNARRSSAFDPATELQLARSINDDRELSDVSLRYCLSGSLITTPETDAVYYCGANGKRFVFPNRRTYDSWYDNFDSVMTISVAELAMIPIGGAVTYRPGKRLVKLQTDPKVYAVGKGGVLRWVSTASVASVMYGSDWAKKIDDLPDAYFANYTIGEPITSTST
ncbi:M23 family metallopeptidase [Patescibacteria group bacterium]